MKLCMTLWVVACLETLQCRHVLTYDILNALAGKDSGRTTCHQQPHMEHPEFH